MRRWKKGPIPANKREFSKEFFFTFWLRKPQPPRGTWLCAQQQMGRKSYTQKPRLISTCPRGDMAARVHWEQQWERARRRKSHYWRRDNFTFKGKAVTRQFRSHTDQEYCSRSTRAKRRVRIQMPLTHPLGGLAGIPLPFDWDRFNRKRRRTSAWVDGITTPKRDLLRRRS